METVTTIKKAEKRGERRTTRSVIFRIFFTVLSTIVLIAFLRPALSDYYSRDVSEPSGRKISLASLITGENARYHYMLGLLLYAVHDKPALKKALNHFLVSLRLDPTDGLVWLAIAKAYRDSDMMEQAGHAMRKAIYLEKNNPPLMWEAGIFFLHQKDITNALQSFRRYIYMVPDDQENVYALCFTLGVTPWKMIENLVPEGHGFYRNFLVFAMSNKLYDASAEIWKRMKKFNPGQSEYLQYCDFLIGVGEMKEARASWYEFVKKYNLTGNNRSSGEMIWNGDFELPVQNGGFDWRTGTFDGVRIFIDKDIRWTGFASLSVNFSGKTNPGLYIARQIVPVDPGQKYRVSGYVRTQDITTLNGIVFEASHFLCDPFMKKSEPVTGTNLWKKIEMEFTTPRKCKAVSVGIKREQSDKFDNKISGDAWIDSLSMIPARN